MLNEKTKQAVDLWEATHKYGLKYTDGHSYEKSMLQEMVEERPINDICLILIGFVLFIMMTGAHF